MDGETHGKLVEALCRTFSQTQLDSFVRKVLGHSLEYYAIDDDLQSVVDKLLNELEKRPQDLEKFLVNLRVRINDPKLRAVTEKALGLAGAGSNPYDALVVLEEPFVDRRIFRDKLRDLFTQNRRAMVARGPEASGKTHSRWLIQHVGEQEQLEVIYFDLERETVKDIVDRMIPEMGIPAKDARDNLGQFASISRGMASVLRGYTTQVAPGAVRRWCLVFDGHDSDKVPDATRELVDSLIAEAANLVLKSIWVIALGYRGTVRADIKPRVLDEDIVPITAVDVQRFFEELATQAGLLLPAEEITALKDFVLNGLPDPLNRDGMITMASRLREKIGQFSY